jgi:hypothetical protein
MPIEGSVLAYKDFLLIRAFMVQSSIYRNERSGGEPRSSRRDFFRCRLLICIADFLRLLA